MIKIKRTKSVEMNYDETDKIVFVKVNGQVLPIPMNKIYQVKRGLESATQRFYRKAVKHG